jgi:hypothetical protein
MYVPIVRTMSHYIMYGGAKFSDAATRWATIKQECYSVYGSAKAAEPYLLARPFFLHNDHQNPGIDRSLHHSHDCSHPHLPPVLHHAVATCLWSLISRWRIHVPYASICQTCTSGTEFAPENSIAIIAKDDISTPSMAAAMVTSVIATYLALCRQFHLGYRR